MCYVGKENPTEQDKNILLLFPSIFISVDFLQNHVISSNFCVNGNSKICILVVISGVSKKAPEIRQPYVGFLQKKQY